MKPLNEKERNEMFGKFIILYFLSLLLLIFAVFFNVKSNRIELSTLRKKVSFVDNSSSKSTEIISSIDSILSNIDRIKDKNSSIDNEELSSKIFNRINQLSNSVQEDSSFSNKVVLRLVNSYSELTKYKRSFIDCKASLENSKVEVKSANERMEKFQSKWSDANARLKENDLPIIP